MTRRVKQIGIVLQSFSLASRLGWRSFSARLLARAPSQLAARLVAKVGDPSLGSSRARLSARAPSRRNSL
jgi:hypothetical protein